MPDLRAWGRSQTDGRAHGAVPREAGQAVKCWRVRLLVGTDTLVSGKGAGYQAGKFDGARRREYF